MNCDFEKILKEKRTQRQRCRGSGSLRSVAPITCIATPSVGSAVFRDLAVTCSMDWSVKLWSLKVTACQNALLRINFIPHSFHACAGGHSMLHTFDDGSDEVTCAAFNPLNHLYICFCRCFRRHRPARCRSTFGRSISWRGAFLFLLRRCFQGGRDEVNAQRARSHPVLIEPARPFELELGERRSLASHWRIVCSVSEKMFTRISAAYLRVRCATHLCPPCTHRSTHFVPRSHRKV